MAPIAAAETRETQVDFGVLPAGSYSLGLEALRAGEGGFVLPELVPARRRRW